MDEHFAHSPVQDDDEDGLLASHDDAFMHAEFRPSSENLDPALSDAEGLGRVDSPPIQSLQHHGHHVHSPSPSNSPIPRIYPGLDRDSSSLFPHSPTAARGQQNLNSSSPRFASAGQQSHPNSAVTATPTGNKVLMPAFIPSDRKLPSRDGLTEENLEDAYAEFIFYCNPQVALDTDATELKKLFSQPPKSDGKTFSTYRLMTLIESLEKKEIKTWTTLAIKLGVERTNEQSTQKVQQYAVRLKRWMHAMHINAFFEYCFGKQHTYFTQIPPIPTASADAMSPAPYPSERDGVPIEEDLALRALHPETKPKRGRRKVEDIQKENGEMMQESPSKRQLLEEATPSTATPTMDPWSQASIYHHSPAFQLHQHPGLLHSHPALPSSAVSDTEGMDGYMGDAISAQDWAAALHSATTPTSASAGPVTARWRINAFNSAGQSRDSPQRPHSGALLTPYTPIDPHHELQTPITPSTPSSAFPLTPGGSKPRSRRRHGPAVSSAWPSSGNPLTGKLRGRPPSNKTSRDGPFSTFPVNPSPTSANGVRPLPSNNFVDLSNTSTPTTPVISLQPQQQQFHQVAAIAPPPRPPPPQIPMRSRSIGGLTLTVPQVPSGNIRMKTPVVTVNNSAASIRGRRGPSPLREEASSATDASLSSAQTPIPGSAQSQPAPRSTDGAMDSFVNEMAALTARLRDSVAVRVLGTAAGTSLSESEVNWIAVEVRKEVHRAALASVALTKKLKDQDDIRSQLQWFGDSGIDSIQVKRTSPQKYVPAHVEHDEVNALMDDVVAAQGNSESGSKRLMRCSYRVTWTLPLGKFANSMSLELASNASTPLVAVSSMQDNDEDDEDELEEAEESFLVDDPDIEESSPGRRSDNNRGNSGNYKKKYLALLKQYNTLQQSIERIKEKERDSVKKKLMAALG